MTIHDILLNCGNVTSETPIYIIKHGVIKMHCDFRDLESRYEKLQFKFFTITSLHTNTFLSYSLAFKFYV